MCDLRLVPADVPKQAARARSARFRTLLHSSAQFRASGEQSALPNMQDCSVRIRTAKFACWKVEREQSPHQRRAQQTLERLSFETLGQTPAGTHTVRPT